MADQKWFDTHVHLDWYRPEQLPAVLDQAEKAGVARVLAVGRSVISSAATVWISHQFRNVYAAVAIHPLWPDSLDDAAYTQLKALTRDSNVIAIGEAGIGVGSGRDPVTTIAVTPEVREAQRQKLARHIRLAREVGLPLIMHNDRASGADIAQIYQREKGSEVGGVLHSTMLDVKDAKRLWEMGVYVSIGRQITRPGFEFLEEVVRQVPETQLIIETDTAGPGPDNTGNPSNLMEVATKVAAARGISMARLRQITVRNTERLFKL